MNDENKEVRERIEKLSEGRENKEFGQVEPDKAVHPQLRPAPTTDDDTQE